MDKGIQHINKFSLLGRGGDKLLVDLTIFDVASDERNKNCGEYVTFYWSPGMGVVNLYPYVRCGIH